LNNNSILISNNISTNIPVIITPNNDSINDIDMINNDINIITNNNNNIINNENENENEN